MIKKWTALAFSALAIATVNAGVVFEVETKDYDRDQSSMSSVSIEDEKLHMEIADHNKGNDGDIIFRGDRQEMVVVDHSEKTYLVMDKETIDSIAGQVNSAMSQMEEALKNVPKEQREMVERMMKDKMPANISPQLPKEEVVKKGDKKKINGYPCVRYDVLQDGNKVRELWVTDWKNVEGGDDAAAVFTKMAEFFEGMMKAVGQMGAQQVGKNMFAQMNELNGFPVVTKNFNDNGDLESESTLRSSKRRAIDPASFEPPAGYKRQSIM